MDNVDQRERLATELATSFAGVAPVQVRRFTTGIAHYVFEATYDGREPVVLRITRPQQRVICQNAATLSRTLRPLGVPLPALLEDGSDAAVPYLILERLPGSDLADCIDTLTEEQLETIARQVAQMQKVVAATPSAGQFGYAARPGQAPHQAWIDVVEEHLARSRSRIASAGLFDLGLVDRAVAVVERYRDELSECAATPFLHDTTTKNVIIAPDGTLSGIVDVDDLCFGDPRYVVALTHASILVMRGPISYTTAWLRHAGYKQDHLFASYVALFLLDFMGEHGQLFNGNEHPSTEQDREHLVRRYRDVLPL